MGFSLCPLCLTREQRGRLTCRNLGSLTGRASFSRGPTQRPELTPRMWGEPLPIPLHESILTLATLHETDHNSNFQTLLVRGKEKPKLCVLCAKTRHLQGGAHWEPQRLCVSVSVQLFLTDWWGGISESPRPPQRQLVLRQGVKTASAFSILPAQGPRAEGCAVCPSSCCQGPKFPQLEHSGDAGPRLTGHPTLPHIWSASNLSALLCKRSSSWELNRGGGRGKNRKQLSEHASDFPKWRRGRGKLSVEGEGFFRLSSLSSGLAQGPPCPSSQMVHLPAGTVDCSSQQVTPGDTSTHPTQKVFSGLWILNSDIISEGVTPSNSSPHPSWGESQTFSAAARSSLLSLSSELHSPLPPEATSKQGGKLGTDRNWSCLPPWLL